MSTETNDHDDDGSAGRADAPPFAQPLFEAMLRIMVAREITRAVGGRACSRAGWQSHGRFDGRRFAAGRDRRDAGAFRRVGR